MYQYGFVSQSAPGYFCMSQGTREITRVYISAGQGAGQWGAPAGGQGQGFGAQGQWGAQQQYGAAQVSPLFLMLQKEKEVVSICDM